ncbi:MAG TPA: hypothetical protein VKK61_03495, partial [Tepidisphaeraceae bacterium]|nr:hypothetical protein [Tepidisphaeraceae bacterium]
MLRFFGKIIGLCAFIAAGSFGIWFYEAHFSAYHQIQKLEEKNRVLTRIVERLSDEKRVAEILVTDQKTINGTPQTTLLLVEYDKSGQSLPPKSFIIEGQQAHIDALVIKFDRHFVSEGDPLRGHSIALFTRIYGDQQSPASAFSIDEPGKIPEIYRGADTRVSEFETDLWKDFWKLADDADYRTANGVRIANGQGVWGPFAPEKLYTITLESDGGLNL